MPVRVPPLAIAIALLAAVVANLALAAHRGDAATTHGGVSVWIRLADCESGDGDGRPPYRADWKHNGYFDGGLQFLPSTWDAARRKREVYRLAWRYAYAYQAPAWVQIAVARNWLRYTSWLQWPVCSRRIGVR